MPRKLLLNLRVHLQLNKGRNVHSEGTAFVTDLDLETQYSESVRNPVQAGEAGGARSLIGHGVDRCSHPSGLNCQ